MKPTRPAYGEPCNGCGVCCIKEQCPLSLFVFNRQPGTCPALEDAGDRYVCGLVVNPQKYNPFRTAAVGRERMSQAAAVLVGSDAMVGCDCAEVGDVANEAYRTRDNTHRRYRNRSQFRKAQKTWGVNF